MLRDKHKNNASIASGLLRRGRGLAGRQWRNFLAFGSGLTSVVTAIAILLTLVPASAATQGQLAGYWKFDEWYGTSGYDYSGADNSVTLRGTTPVNDQDNWTDSKNGFDFYNDRGIVFNGTDYADVNDTGAYDVSSGSFSISTWFKASQSEPSLQYLASKLTDDGNTGYAMSINTYTNPNKLYLNMRLGDDQGNAMNWGYTIPSGTNNNGGWHYVAATINRNSNTVTYYIDGASVGTRSIAGLSGSLSNDGKLTFGRQSHSNNGYLNGAMDDTRFYTRTLTSGEVADLAAQKHTTATWNGNSSVNFDDAGNWDIGGVPDAYTHVIVPGDANQGMFLNQNATLQSLTVNTGGSVDIGDSTLEIDDGGVVNNGTMLLDSGNIYVDYGWDNNGLFTNNNGSVTVDDDLNIGNGGVFEAGDGGLSVDEDISIVTGGTLDGGSASIWVDESWYNDGTFDAGTSSVSFGNWYNYIGGDNTWYDFYKNGWDGGITFEADKTQTILNHISLSGWNDGDGINYLYLRSSDGPTQWNIDVQGTYDFEYLDVEDSNNISTDVLTARYSYDSDNNIRWNINGPALSIDDSIYDGDSWSNYSNDTTPTLPFTITSVADAQYRIQIDNNSNFSSPLVDYTSDFAAQGGRTFTVGQAAGSGSYTVGSASTVLVNGTYYYWRAMAIDGGTLESEWQYGDFGVDTSAPTNPSFDPSSNYVSSGTHVYLDCSDSGGSELESIYYTIDGNTPNNSSWWYDSGEGIVVNSTTTIKAICYDYAGNTSSVITKTYTIDNLAPNTPSANVGSGTYNSTRNVTITAADNGDAGIENIYYTLDGSTPDNNSSVYSGAVSISENATLKAIAYDNAGNASGVLVRNYVIDSTAPDAPTADPEGGSYNTTQHVTLSSNDDNSGLNLIRYTTDGSTPVFPVGGASQTYTSSITVSGNMTIKAKAFDNAGNASDMMTEVYVIDTTAPDDPVADPAGGSYSSAQSVSLSVLDNVGGTGVAGIYYTTDGSTPDNSSTEYTSALNISTDTTLKFIAYDNAGNASDVVTEVYNINANDPDAPTNLGPENYIDNRWGNDNTPTLDFDLHDDDGNTVKYRIQITNDSSFNTVVVDYTSALGSEGSKSFTVGQAAGSGSYATGTSGQTLGNGGYYWRVRAIDSGDRTSGFTAANGGNGAFRIDTTNPTTSGTPTGTTPTADNTPAISWTAGSDANSGLANPAYTLLWSDNDSVLIGSKTTNSLSASPDTGLADGTWYFRVRTTDAAGNTTLTSSSLVVVIDTTGPATPVPTPAAGSYASTQNVTLASTDGGSGLSHIYYTTNGSTPTNSSTQYSGAISVSSNRTIKAIAYDNVGNTSSVLTAAYVIDTTAPTLTGSVTNSSDADDTTPTWTWTAANDTGGAGLKNPAYIVQWADNADYNSPTQDTSNTTSFTQPSDLECGTWYFRVWAQDNVDNHSDWITGSTTITCESDGGGDGGNSGGNSGSGSGSSGSGSSSSGSDSSTGSGSSSDDSAKKKTSSTDKDTGTTKVTTSLVNPLSGSNVMLELPAGTTLTCQDIQDASGITVSDGDWRYPAGLVNFCFSTGAEDNKISLTFITDLTPETATVRKYNPNTQTYAEIGGATITQTTVDGKPALKVTYTITDNGPLDTDPAVGSITDPVGIAVKDDGSSNSGTSPVKDTSGTTAGQGSSTAPTATYMWIGIGVTAAGLLIILFAKRRRKDDEEDKK